MPRTGRPKAEIDDDAFEKLCSLMCTEAEIAHFFRVSPDTIERWCKRTYNETFAEVFKKKCSGGKIALRRIQFRLAETNPAMAIFLGKQYLGQRDRFEETFDDKETPSFKFEVVDLTGGKKIED